MICPPFAGEHFKVYRILFNACRYLASRGFTMLRFDYSGTGDSSGDFESARAEHWVSNVVDVARFLRTSGGAEQVGLIGCRLGAAWAALAAEALGADVDHLVLWDPVCDAGAYLYNQLRANLSEQAVLHGKIIENRDRLLERMRAGEVVSIAGYEFTSGFYDSASAVNLLRDVPKLRPDLKVVVLATEPVTEFGEAAKFVRALGAERPVGPIVPLPKEVSWDLSKDYLTYPERTFELLAAALSGEAVS